MPESALPAERASCSRCQRVLKAHARYCSHCGHAAHRSLDGPAAAPGADPEAGFNRRWAALRPAGWLFGLLLATTFALGLVERIAHSPWVQVSAGAIDALVVLAFALAHSRALAPLLGLPRWDRRTSGLLLALALGFIAAMSGYFAILQHLGIPMIRMSEDFQAAGWPVGSMFVLVSIMPAVIEELGFRGVIQSHLEHALGAREAWLTQAALFSVLHLSPIIFPSHFVMGLVFGFMRLRSRSLYPGMLLHASWNALALSQELYMS